MSSALLYLAIVAIWAVVLVPRWVRRSHETPGTAENSPAQGAETVAAGPPAADAPVPEYGAAVEHGAAVEYSEARADGTVHEYGAAVEYGSAVEHGTTVAYGAAIAQSPSTFMSLMTIALRAVSTAPDSRSRCSPVLAALRVTPIAWAISSWRPSMAAWFNTMD